MNKNIIKNILCEGLNIPKKNGWITFGRVEVFFEVLDQIHLNSGEIIQKPIKLTYKIDGEDFPDDLSDERFNSFMKVLSGEFDNNIKPYFEDRGYYLWSY